MKPLKRLNIIKEDFDLYINLLNQFIHRNNKTIHGVFEYARSICSDLPSHEECEFDTPKRDKGLFGKMIGSI